LDERASLLEFFPPQGGHGLDIIARATKTLAKSRPRGLLLFESKTGSKNSADVSTAFTKIALPNAYETK